MPKVIMDIRPIKHFNQLVSSYARLEHRPANQVTKEVDQKLAVIAPNKSGRGHFIAVQVTATIQEASEHWFKQTDIGRWESQTEKYVLSRFTMPQQADGNTQRANPLLTCRTYSNDADEYSFGFLIVPVGADGSIRYTDYINARTTIKKVTTEYENLCRRFLKLDIPANTASETVQSKLSQEQNKKEDEKTPEKKVHEASSTVSTKGSEQSSAPVGETKKEERSVQRQEDIGTKNEEKAQEIQTDSPKQDKKEDAKTDEIDKEKENEDSKEDVEKEEESVPDKNVEEVAEGVYIADIKQNVMQSTPEQEVNLEHHVETKAVDESRDKGGADVPEHGETQETQEPDTKDIDAVESEPDVTDELATVDVSMIVADDEESPMPPLPENAPDVVIPEPETPVIPIQEQIHSEELTQLQQDLQEARTTVDMLQDEIKQLHDTQQKLMTITSLADVLSESEKYKAVLFNSALRYFQKTNDTEHLRDALELMNIGLLNLNS